MGSSLVGFAKQIKWFIQLTNTFLCIQRELLTLATITELPPRSNCLFMRFLLNINIIFWRAEHTKRWTPLPLVAIPLVTNSMIVEFRWTLKIPVLSTLYKWLESKWWGSLQRFWIFKKQFYVPFIKCIYSLWKSGLRFSYWIFGWLLIKESFSAICNVLLNLHFSLFGSGNLKKTFRTI